MPEPSVSLLICTTPRSGSSYFANTLRSAGCFGMPEEWLHPYNYEPILRQKGLPSEVSASTLINCLRECATTDDGVFAVKTMWDRFEIFLKKAREEYERDDILRGAIPDRLDWPSVKEYFPASRIILLTRKDRVGQAISYIRAHQTGVWHRIEGGQEGIENTSTNEFREQRQRNYFDPNFIKLIMDNFRWQEESWRKLFWLECIKPLEIEYDSFLQNKESVIRQVAELMGLPFDAINSIKEPPNKPVRDSLKKSWRALYSELVNDQNEFNEQSPPLSCGGHWLFQGRNLSVETPYPVFHGNHGATIHHYFSVKNLTSDGLFFTVNENGETLPATLRLQAVWTSKGNAIHRIVAGEVSLRNEFMPYEQHIVRLPIHIPNVPDKWVLRILPVLSSENCDYRLLGTQVIRMRFHETPLL